MQLLRIIILLGIIYLGYRLLRKLVKNKSSGTKNPKTTRMVRCAYCNVYIVREDALEKDEIYFCSTEHYNKSLKQQ